MFSRGLRLAEALSAAGRQQMGEGGLLTLFAEYRTLSAESSPLRDDGPAMHLFHRGFYRLLFVKQRDCPLPIQRLSIKTTVLCMATNTSVKSIAVTVGYNRASASEK